MCRLVFCLLIILCNNEIFALGKTSRQKRCIVIQKQSSGTAEAGEGNDDEDYDFKGQQPKAPKPDRLQNYRNGLEKNEVETLTPAILKSKRMPNQAMYRRLKMRNRLSRNYFGI